MGTHITIGEFLAISALTIIVYALGKTIYEMWINK